MPLILAIDRDRRQAAQLALLVRRRLRADLCQAGSAAEALEALGSRLPDLILTSPLLSQKDDDLLAAHLRELGTRAAHIQTLRIPVLGASASDRSDSGVLARLRGGRKPVSAPNACDPDLFAAEIAEYLARAAEEREAFAAEMREPFVAGLPQAVVRDSIADTEPDGHAPYSDEAGRHHDESPAPACEIPFRTGDATPTVIVQMAPELMPLAEQQQEDESAWSVLEGRNGTGTPDYGWSPEVATPTTPAEEQDESAWSILEGRDGIGKPDHAWNPQVATATTPVEEQDESGWSISEARDGIGKPDHAWSPEVARATTPVDEQDEPVWATPGEATMPALSGHERSWSDLDPPVVLAEEHAIDPIVADWNHDAPLAIADMALAIEDWDPGAAQQAVAFEDLECHEAWMAANAAPPLVLEPLSAGATFEAAAEMPGETSPDVGEDFAALLASLVEPDEMDLAAVMSAVTDEPLSIQLEAVASGTSAFADMDLSASIERFEEVASEPLVAAGAVEVYELMPEPELATLASTLQQAPSGLGSGGGQSARHDTEARPTPAERSARTEAPPAAAAPEPHQRRATDPVRKKKKATAVAARTGKSTRATRAPAAKPVQDEWGFFDPDQCGFSALVAKLDEVTDDERTLRERKRSAARILPR